MSYITIIIHYKSAIPVNVSIDEKPLEYDNGIFHVDVTHHWAEKSLDYLFQNDHDGSLKKCPSTALSPHALKDATDLVDKRFTFKHVLNEKAKKNTSQNFFFVCPDQPRRLPCHSRHLQTRKPASHASNSAASYHITATPPNPVPPPKQL